MAQAGVTQGSWYRLVRSILPQLTILGLLALLKVLSSAGLTPSLEAMAAKLTALFVTGGLPIIGMASFAENLVGLNVYFPGAIVIVIAMSLTAGDLPRAFATYAAITGPAMGAQVLNYLAGRFFGNRLRPAAATESRRRGGSGVWAVFLTTFAHPHLAALTCFAAGSEGLRLRQFLVLLVVSGVLWSTAYATVIYNLGAVAGATENLIPVFYSYAAVWLVWGIWAFFRDERTAGVARTSEPRSASVRH